MAPRKQSTRNASGSGTIRKKIIQRGNKTYTYWEARYTDGFDPGTGRQVQRSISEKTQKEVAQKLKAVTASIDAGTYIAPNKMTLKEWLEIWHATYLNNVKPRTVETYGSVIRIHILPALGATRLEALNAHTIQKFYNDCVSKKHLSGKSVKNVHCVMHMSLKQAVACGYLRFNPSEACTLPRVEKADLKPFDDIQIAAFLNEIRGTKLEALLTLTLFTGLREGEVLGLTWNNIDFERGSVTINKQLQYQRNTGESLLVSPKNGKGRVIVPASFVMDILKKRRTDQAADRQLAGDAWKDSDLVFTDELGDYLRPWTPYRAFKRAAAAIGRPDARFHDLRHSYAVAAIRSGDDIKTVQGNLGHATSSFTLDVYGHVTDQMKQESAARMDRYIKQITG